MGVTIRAKGPRRGEVLRDRYEVRGRLRNDAFSLGFLVYDLQKERSLVMRIVRPELVDGASEARAVSRRLRLTCGNGGNYLPGLLDADAEGPYAFAIEKVPEGASLRRVIDKREADNEPFSCEEVLPVLAHLEAALAAIPDGMFHGDLRAENVWIDPERLQLTGPFLVPSLTTAALKKALVGEGERYAPELRLEGEGSRASDLYGVAAIINEMLKTGSGGDASSKVESLLAAVLEPDLSERAIRLWPLLEALSSQAGLPVPELEPAPFRDGARPSSRPQRRSSIPPVDPPTVVMASEDVLRTGEQERRRRLNETERKAQALGAGLDPRLVRAAFTDRSERAHLLEAASTWGDPQLKSKEGALKGVVNAAAKKNAEVGSSSTEEPAPVKAASHKDIEGASTKERAAQELASSVEDLTPPDMSGLPPASEPVSPAEPVELVPPDASPRFTAAKSRNVKHETQQVSLEELSFDDAEVEEAPTELFASRFSTEFEVPSDPNMPAQGRPDGTQEIGIGELEQLEGTAAFLDSAPELEELKSMKPLLERPDVRDAERQAPSLASSSEPLALAPEPILPISSAESVSLGSPSPSPGKSDVRPLSLAPSLGGASLNRPSEVPVTERSTSQQSFDRTSKIRRRSIRHSGDPWMLLGALVLAAIIIISAVVFSRYRARQATEQRIERQLEAAQNR